MSKDKDEVLSLPKKLCLAIKSGIFKEISIGFAIIGIVSLITYGL